MPVVVDQAWVALIAAESSCDTSVNLIRTDDALGAVQQGKVDVAVVRGHVTSPAVRVVHLFNESRVPVCLLTRPWRIDRSWTGPRSRGGRWL